MYNTKKMKVLIIEDQAENFYAIKRWLANLGYSVIPEKFDEMKMAIDDDSGFGVEEFVQKQLKNHYLEIGLILCDINFRNHSMKGISIVKHIRDFNNLSPSYWTTIVPIICMTNYADQDMLEDSTLLAGADYLFSKTVIFNGLKRHNENSINEAITYRTIINTQIEKFQKNLMLFYPRGLEYEIIQFKDKQKNRKTAYIMTSHQNRHMDIARQIQSILYEYNIKGYIANTQRWMSPSMIWDNIQVFMHSCDFGIAIYTGESFSFENASEDISLQVGYMLGLQKEICFLKHQELKKLPLDLNGMMFVEFTSMNLKNVFTNWLINRQIY